MDQMESSMISDIVGAEITGFRKFITHSDYFQIVAICPVYVVPFKPFSPFCFNIMTERTTFHPQWVKNTKIIPASHPRETSTVQYANARVHIVLDDYETTTPVPDNALTLILTHGTSFSRVFWEAIMADLVSRSALDSSIKRIIAVDAVNHGDSAVYNTGKLSSRGKLHVLISRPL